ncbi:MmgE/PrpD family protein [Burkholderia sp. L27(2015)]|uniref:MmgE/PrpD family protein n=1 Tax=Burkholderia sp. L27(2015) TaxID=1641858 RepID=UPI00131B66DB|nr:MmgE/PrpD family protein [Burkholderia sp. L27(2015)]
MTQTSAERVAQHFHDFSYARVPVATRDAVKRLLLDYLGVGLSGSQSESGRIAREFAKTQGGVEQATVIGGNMRVPAVLASFANAISAHSIELDDIDVLALFHFSPPVFSAALAVGEAVGASGEALITALAAGCEMMERVSRAANSSLRNRGFHTTPTTGVFGATIAAAYLMKLTPDQIVSALGLAGAQACGLMEMYGPSMQKRFNPGPAARNGVTAATMASLGFTGAATIFDGERGFLRAFTDKHDARALTEGLDAPYELLIEFKPYSCARPIHNAIDCALTIRKQHKPDLMAIRRIVMERHPDWAHYHQNKTPATYHEAQVSLPYSVAVALEEGAALFAQYRDDKLKQPGLLHAMDVIEIVANDTLPRGVSCRMTMEMNDGSSYVAQVDDPKGSIGNPMNNDELRIKFDSLAMPVIGADGARRLADAVAGIESSDVASLMGLTMR